MKKQIKVRQYHPEDAQALADIYYNTIHQVNSKDYSKEQVDVWAPENSLDGDRWVEKFLRTQPLIAISGEEVVGFAEFELDGHIDCFYCHHEWIGHGVGSALMNAIHEQAEAKEIGRIYAEVSITAKPFFERQGFSTLVQQSVVRDGVELINFQMEKRL